MMGRRARRAKPKATLRHHGGKLLFVTIAAYLCLIVYGSLFPFSGWRPAPGEPWAFLLGPLPEHYSRPDLFVNIVAYVPLGGLLYALGSRIWHASMGAAMAVIVGSAVSLSMEITQTYLPSRVPSLGDLIANAAGTALGVFSLYVVLRCVAPGEGRGAQVRANWLKPGVAREFGLGVAGLAMFILLSPVVPALGGSMNSLSVLPAWRTLIDTSAVGVEAILLYAGEAFALMTLAALCMRRERARASGVLLLVAIVMWAKFAVVVLFLQIPSSQWIWSARALLGFSVAWFALAVVMRRIEHFAWIACLALVVTFVREQLAPSVAAAGTGPVFHPFNWIPFSAQIHGSTGVLDILGGGVRFLALGCVANLAVSMRRRRMVMWGGAVMVFGFAFASELAQPGIVGRHGDVTDTILPMFGWLCAWIWPAVPDAAPEAPAPIATESTQSALVVSIGRRRMLRSIIGVLALAGMAAVLGGLLAPVEQPVNGAARIRHPLPQDLPDVSLPSFQYTHPRLPAPSSAEVATMRERNPEYLAEMRRRANGGRGDLYAALLMALIEPGSQDLDGIFVRLIAEKFHYRANGTEIVALGYDWLHPYWSDTQRKQLMERLIDGAEFAYNVIRDEQLSPYNVYLYNSPFQRLLMLAIAQYGDDPRGDVAMRAAHYMLNHEVLPVWRQVMGRNGGWHEGGEYVGIGIGQAVYRVPAMWRKATGQDLFVSEIGLRGFLDFLVYRTRPDGMHLHMGDAAFFDRNVPDQVPLALELRHAAAYGTGARAYAPTGWPWGPLADPGLKDPLALSRLPTSRYFDGIGLVVARSDWSDTATYVTFKAGDNFWSHMHLDQGSFTIYKGGALAIDSGLYGPQYGADHHMNYTYQTIAHNAITVTDPEDTQSVKDRRGETRSFANDGGQRRVGSGWGIEPAPINREDWELRREIYHTGRIVGYYEGDGLTIAVADVTPAYTNEYSGKGMFSHRTRRVERMWRIFGYDRIEDAIVVQDQVVSTEAEFRKCWLLHSVDAPSITGREFSVVAMPRNGVGHAGGQMKGVVLEPEGAILNVIGGRGLEFFVDGKNYDESGEMDKAIARKPGAEAGAYRLEITPGRQQANDRFLVVLLPSALGAAPPRAVKRISDDGRAGAEISGQRRTTRWWYRQGENAVEVEILGASGVRMVRVGPGDGVPAPVE